MNTIILQFPKSSKITGETKINGKTDWVELLSYNHGLTMQITGDISNTKRTSGKPNVNDISITKYVDKTTPLISQSCCEGKPIGQVVIELAQVEKGAYHCYLRYTLSDVIISSVSVGSSSHDKPLESISLNFSKIKWEWNVQDNTGTSKGSTSGIWDIATNQAK